MLFKEKSKLNDACLFVILGATGDLSQRKLFPAFAQMAKQKLLPDNFKILAVSRRSYNSERFRKFVASALKEFSNVKSSNSDMKSFLSSIYYCKLDFYEKGDYETLKGALGRLNNKCNKTIYYLATLPENFGIIVENLNRTNLLQRESSWPRIVFEKPFGYDIKSANMLNKKIYKYFKEDQIYRIDHYLGKNAIQNVMILRFANGIFEPLWNGKYIDHIQITASENIGVGFRTAYYEKAGVVRDMVQNHLLQTLSLIAMEPPASFTSRLIHDEKTKVLDSISQLKKEDIVLGQYIQGKIDNKHVLGYKEELNKRTRTETFAAIKVFIDNWRWKGVPFYLRSGKRMVKSFTRISIHFKNPPHNLFHQLHNIEQNILDIDVQPKEGVMLEFNTKAPGENLEIKKVGMDFCHSCIFPNTPKAYESLLMDVIEGDNTLFTRWDQVKSAWKLIDPLLKRIRNKEYELHSYHAGTTGPKASDRLIEKDGRKWLN